MSYIIRGGLHIWYTVLKLVKEDIIVLTLKKYWFSLGEQLEWKRQNIRKDTHMSLNKFSGGIYRFLMWITQQHSKLSSESYL